MFAAHAMLLAGAGAGAGVYVDDFNRADTTSGLGSAWTARVGIIGIDANQASPMSSAGVIYFSSYGTAMPGDDMEVAAVIGAGNGNAAQNIVTLPLGANASGAMA